MKWSIHNIRKNWLNLWNLWRNLLAIVTTIVIIAIFVNYVSVDDPSKLSESLSGIVGFLSVYTYRLYLILIIMFLIALLVAFYLPFFKLSSKWRLRRKIIIWPIILTLSLLALYFVTIDFTDMRNKIFGWMLLFLVVVFLTGYPIRKEYTDESTTIVNAKNKSIDTKQRLIGEVILAGIFTILLIKAVKKTHKHTKY